MSQLGNVIRTGSRKIYGVLAPPRVSRNNNFYTPETLMQGDGLKVPVYDQHEDFEMGRDGKPTGRILAKEARGAVRLVWNNILQRLEYVGEIWDKGLQKLINAGERLHVSLAAEPRNFEVYRGMKVPLDLQFFSIATVKNPGIPEATLNMEMYIDRMAPIMLESASGTANMVLLEFDTESQRTISEHDFDQAIAALKAADQIADGTKEKTELNPDEYYSRDGVGTDPWSVGSGAGTPVQKPIDQQAAPPPRQFPPAQPPMQQHPMMPPQQQAPPMQHPTIPPGQPQQNPMIPQGYQNLTPMAGMANLRSGLPGVTGTSNITPMQGTGVNPPRPMQQPAVHPPISPTGQNQQMLPRNPVMPSESSPVNNEASTSRRSQMTDSTLAEDDGRGDASSANPKAFGADGAGDLVKPHSATVKGIGQTDNTVGTPFESSPSLGGKGGDAGDLHNNPSRMPTMRPKEAKDEEEEEEEVKEAASYGFSKEEFLDIKSTYQPREFKKMWESFKLLARMSPKLREGMRRQRLESSGVTNSLSIAQQRESREGGANVIPTGHEGIDKYNIRNGISKEDLEEHVKILSIGRPGGVMRGHEGRYFSPVPLLNVPRITKNGGLGPRLEFADQLESWTDQQREFVTEAIATTTSGTAMAIDGAVPALIVPTNLAAMLRDTVYYQQIQQGSNTIYFQTITVPAAGALTENTQPSDASQTLARVSVSPTPRGVGQPISFEAERKVLGPILEAVILSFRVSELYDEDNLLIGSGNAFESSSYPTTGGPYIAGGSSTGNAIYGPNGRASEATIISTDTFNFIMFSAAQDAITANGYSPDNLVAVVHPNQYRGIITDTTYLSRLLSFGPNTTPGQSWIAQGVIPEIAGFEVRRSTLMKTGTGSASITTYRGWAYKKGLTAGLGASRDMMIESYRNVLLNNTYVKAHWDFAYAVLQPNSLVLLDSA